MEQINIGLKFSAFGAVDLDMYNNLDLAVDSDMPRTASNPSPYFSFYGTLW